MVHKSSKLQHDSVGDTANAFNFFNRLLLLLLKDLAQKIISSNHTVCERSYTFLEDWKPYVALDVKMYSADLLS